MILPFFRETDGIDSEVACIIMYSLTLKKAGSAKTLSFFLEQDSSVPSSACRTYCTSKSKVMEVVESYGLSNVLTHPPLTNLSSSEFLNENSGPGVNVQQVLPPVDGGYKAWSFCAAAFVLEALVWGFGFTCVTLLFNMEVYSLKWRN